MNVVISQPMLFPWVGFFEQIRLCDKYIHYNDVQFSKGGFTNRVQVKSPSSSKWLTVPLANLHLGQSIDEVKINPCQDWRGKHMQLLDNCYGDAPYFLEMMEIVDSVYSKDFEFIDDLAFNSILAVADYLNFTENTSFLEIKSLSIPGSSSQRVLEVVKAVNGDCYITGHGAKNYLDHESFDKAGIKVKYMNYEKKPYTQQFGAFDPYVSILDLIANKGKRGIDWVCSETIDWELFISE